MSSSGLGLWGAWPPSALGVSLFFACYSRKNLEPRCYKSNATDPLFEKVSNSFLLPLCLKKKKPKKQDVEIKSKGIPVEARKMHRLLNVDYPLTGIWLLDKEREAKTGRARWRVVCKPKQHRQLGEGKKKSLCWFLNGAIDPVPMESAPSGETPTQQEDRCSLDICPTSLTLKLLISSARELVNPVKQWAARRIDTVREGSMRVTAPNNTPAAPSKALVHALYSYWVRVPSGWPCCLWASSGNPVSRNQRLFMSRWSCLWDSFWHCLWP